MGLGLDLLGGGEGDVLAAARHVAEEDAQQRLVVVIVELEGVLELEAARKPRVAAPYEGLHLLAVAEQQHAAVGARVTLYARHERVDDGRLERVAAAAAAAARRAEAAAAVGVQPVGFVDDQYTALGLG